jgi:hypothetical protein
VGAVPEGYQPIKASKPKDDDELIEKKEKEKTTAPAPITYGKPAEIRIISGNNQSGEVNNKLPEAIVVEIRDQFGNLLENEAVVFSAEEGAGTFPNKSKEHKILTDEEGRVQTELFLSKKAGEKTIRVTAERGDNLSVTLLTIAKPTPSEKFIELDGNFQTGQMDKRLPKPFIVAVRDKYDNPIQQHAIEFRLKKGTGKFQDSLNAHYSTITNEDGLAEAYFIMGNSRGAREIEVEATKVEPSKIKFEVFAV